MDKVSEFPIDEKCVPIQAIIKKWYFTYGDNPAKPLMLFWKEKCNGKKIITWTTVFHIKYEKEVDSWLIRDNIDRLIKVSWCNARNKTSRSSINGTISKCTNVNVNLYI